MSELETAREAFFAAAGAREAELRALDEFIRSGAPALTPVVTVGMGMTMLGYGPIPYKTKAMKEPKDWPIVALAPRKAGLSLYLSALQDGRYIAEANAERLGKVSVGKSCVRFKKLADLDLDALRDILTDLDRRYRSGEQIYGF
ncbi:DUF1801 domain-containing protein [Nocardia sp. 2]|uniref:DUF1801 domain-containing protein n=1 Tax=Nocardia acididurans TaxID=2802282 RepID=A0ABS1ME01_9NOCA|nr:DUF1801 domain-containing protein [Nocardia acididurans]MBL1078886.1 DUF1801 domain-containing protein [Nocardia acididurans]